MQRHPERPSNNDLVFCCNLPSPPAPLPLAGEGSCLRTTPDVPRTRKDDIREAFFSCVHDALFQTGPHRRETAGAGKSWLLDQGFELDASGRLAVGVFDDPAAITHEIIRAGFGLEEVIDSKLVSDERLTGRLVGPIRDVRGRIVSFWARHPEGRSPQYLYLNGGWQKDAVAYGLDVVSSCVLEGQGNLLVMHDLLDVLLLHSRGFLDAVALGQGGVRLTAERWQRLADLGIRRVTLTLNQGEGCPEDLLASLENAMRAKAPPTVFVLPPEKCPGVRGPAEFVRREGAAALHDFLERERVDGRQYVLEHLSVHGSASSDQWQPNEEHTAATPDLLTLPQPAPQGESDRRPQCPMHHCSETDCFCFD